MGVRVRGIESSALLFCHGFTNLLQSLILLCSCRAGTLRSGAGSVPVTWRRLQNTYTSCLQVTPNSGGKAVDVLRAELLSREPCRNRARGIQQGQAAGSAPGTSHCWDVGQALPGRGAALGQRARKYQWLVSWTGPAVCPGGHLPARLSEQGQRQ